MSLKILFRGKVLLAIIIFTTITCTAIIYTSIRSLRLDREHLALLELSKNIDLEISHSRIYLDDYFLFNDTLKKSAVLSCFTATNQYIISLDSLITQKYKGDREQLLQEALKSVNTQAKQLQRKISLFVQNDAIDFDIDILNHYHNFQLDHQHLLKKIDDYILHENFSFKKRVFILLLLTFFLLLVCIFLIHRIINSYNTIEKQQAIRSLEVEFKERKRIAADLHDGLGSILSSIALFIKLIEKDCKNNTENKSLIQVKELSEIALENLESTINNLNPSILNKYGLIKSLEILCDKINDIGEVSCTIKATNENMKFDPNIELNLYRICNELINNTLKHANASNLDIEIQQIKKTVMIVYRDNGIGFNPELISNTDEEKMGLRNIINRIESLGGKYKIDSEKGKGVEIMLSFKL